MLETEAVQEVSNLTSALVRDIQLLHTFDSCATVINLYLPFPSGVYKIQWSSTNPIQMYSSTRIAFSCNGIPGL